MRCGASYKLVEGAIPPKRSCNGDAGLDIAIQEDVKIRPGETVYAPAGVIFDIPEGFAVHVVTRSSTFKHDVVVVPTVVDSGYKGEISTIITNFNVFPVEIKRGTRLAQAVLMPYYQFDNEFDNDVERLPVERGENKFGSSGI